MKEGWAAVTATKGLIVLVVVSSLICLFMGVFQVLGEPFVLSFSDSKTLGIVETAAASGMLVTSILLGIRGIKKRFVRALWMGLAVSGVGMAMFAVFKNPSSSQIRNISSLSSSYCIPDSFSPQST